MERENNLLHQELQSKGQDGSESDVSETIREQHRELVEVVQNKNKHISELLRDIEVQYCLLYYTVLNYINVNF